MSKPQELWRLSATELVAGFAARDFTPGDSLASVLERCGDVNDTLNAVIALNPRAMDDAAASSARWRAGKPSSRLDGVPMTIKDNLLVSGIPATWGSKAFADFVPDHDEEPVARLRAAGLVFIGKTNVPELTLQGYTDNLLFGPTGNPWAPGLTPGGSSGGAAAAVAAGIGPLALCTDGGGSIRRPAAHTGIFGFKPSSGAVARGNGFPAILGAFEVVGPVAHTLADIVLMFNVLAEPAREKPIPKPPRVLYARSFGAQPVDREIAASVDQYALAIESLGWPIERRDTLDIFASIDEIWPVVSTSGVAFLFDTFPDLRRLAGPDIVAMAKMGSKHTGRDYAGAMAAITDLECAFRTAMADFDLLLTPAIAALSWPRDISHPPTIADQLVGPRGHAVFTAFANALGLPALSIPAALSKTGLPLGVQLIGKHGTDHHLLALAAKLPSEAGPLPYGL